MARIFAAGLSAGVVTWILTGVAPSLPGIAAATGLARVTRVARIAGVARAGAAPWAALVLPARRLGRGRAPGQLLGLAGALLLGLGQRRALAHAAAAQRPVAGGGGVGAGAGFLFQCERDHVVF